MSTYAHSIHVRLDSKEKQGLEQLKKSTGKSISALIREAVSSLCQKKLKKKKTGKDFREFAGIFASGYTDLSTNKKHMEGYGE